MGTKARPPSADAEKGEIGEIDTRAPIQSVKAAVSLFGEVRFSSDKSAERKPKAPQTEVIKHFSLSKLFPLLPFVYLYFRPEYVLTIGWDGYSK